MLFELNSCLRGNLNSQNGFKRKVDIVFQQLMESNVLPIVFEIVKQGISDIIFKKKKENKRRTIPKYFEFETELLLDRKQ